MVASTSAGSLFLIKVVDHENDIYEIKVKVPWNDLHKFPSGEASPCTGLSHYEEDIVTIGEDGRINFLTARRETLIRTIGNIILFNYCYINYITYQRNLITIFKFQKMRTVVH